MSNRSLSISSLLIDNLDDELDNSRGHFKDEGGTSTNTILPKASYDAWVHALKSVLSSFADVASDWIFFSNVWGDRALHRFELALLFTCVVSTCASILVIIMEYKRLQNPKEKLLFGLPYKYFNAFEIVLEDCPQIILAGWIQMDQKGWSPEGIFNITVSVNNSFNGLLDLMKPDKPNTNPVAVAVAPVELQEKESNQGVHPTQVPVSTHSL